MQPKFAPAVLALSLLSLSGAASAQDEGADYTLTGNAAVTSDYIFRGITQSWGDPSINGGGDLTMKNGFAAGFWASSMSNKSFPGASFELDIYGSYGASINEDWSWRAGLYGYIYPGGDLDEARPPLVSRSFNTVEANIALTWKYLTLKYNHTLTDFFGVDTEQGYRDDSKGTGYLQLDAAIPINEQWSLALHVGHTNFSTELAVPLSNGEDDPSYSDYGATVKYQFTPHFSVSGGVTYADNSDFYEHTVSFRNASDTKDIGGSRGFVQLQATF